MKTLQLSIIAIAGIAIAGTIFFVLVEQQKPTSEIKPKMLEQTLTTEDVKSIANFTVKVPSNLPYGYEFIGAQASPIDAKLMYWNQTITESDFASPEQIAQGAIVILYKLENEEVDPAYRTANRTAYIISLYDELTPSFKVRLTHILGNLALVREGCDSCGIQSAIFADGSKIVTNVPAPTLIAFYDGDVEYVIESSLPSKILEQMAQSMR